MNKSFYLLVLLISVMTYSCDIDQTKGAKLPDVDVDVTTQAGQMPAFDVDWAEVNVGTKTTTVTVPKVVVVMEEVEVEVPYVDVDMPDDKEREERAIVVESEVSGKVHDLQIKEIYATGKRLFVVSELTPKSQKLGKETMRISDRVVLNAPDLDVKHYIIGNRPKGEFNRQFSYVANRSAIASKLANGKQIYSK